MALAGPALQALLPAVGRAGVMSAAADVAGQTTQFAGRLLPYLPALGQVFNKDPLGAAVTAGVTKLTPGGMGAKLIAGIATSLLAPPALAATGQLAQNLLGKGERQEMARGESPGIFGIPGLGAKDIGGLDAGVIERLARATGKTQVEVAEALYPLQQRGRDADLQRQMQINQQTGQITGALNRQLYMAQLAGGAQAQAGETVRTMMTAPNPYAASAFQYRG